MMMIISMICYDIDDNSTYNDTDNNDEANNDDEIDSKKDNHKDEHDKYMVTNNVSLVKVPCSILKGCYLRFYVGYFKILQDPYRINTRILTVSSQDPVRILVGSCIKDPG